MAVRGRHTTKQPRPRRSRPIQTSRYSNRVCCKSHLDSPPHSCVRDWDPRGNDSVSRTSLPFHAKVNVASVVAVPSPAVVDRVRANYHCRCSWVNLLGSKIVGSHVVVDCCFAFCCCCVVSASIVARDVPSPRRTEISAEVLLLQVC